MGATLDHWVLEHSTSFGDLYCIHYKHGVWRSVSRGLSIQHTDKECLLKRKSYTLTKYNNFLWCYSIKKARVTRQGSHSNILANICMNHGYSVIRAYLLVGHDMRVKGLDTGHQWEESRSKTYAHFGTDQKIKYVRNQMGGSAATVSFVGKFPDLWLS